MGFSASFGSVFVSQSVSDRQKRESVFPLILFLSKMSFILFLLFRPYKQDFCSFFFVSSMDVCVCVCVCVRVLVCMAVYHLLKAVSADTIRLVNPKSFQFRLVLKLAWLKFEKTCFFLRNLKRDHLFMDRTEKHHILITIYYVFQVVS